MVDDMKRFLVYEESSRRVVMTNIWAGYMKGYINEMKEMWCVGCWDKHRLQRDTRSMVT